MTDRMQNAFHEAGHLAVAYLLMRRSAAIGGAWIYSKTHEASDGATFIMPRLKIAEKILNTYHLAGMYAEALALNDGKPVTAWPDESSDVWKHAADEIGDLDAETIECSGRFAEDFLRRCWPFVCAIAKKLERDGIIVLRELHAIYRRYYPGNGRNPAYGGRV